MWIETNVKTNLPSTIKVVVCFTITILQWFTTNKTDGSCGCISWKIPNREKKESQRVFNGFWHYSPYFLYFSSPFNVIQ